MKITRQSKTDYTKEELRRIKANKRCNICPNCGESKKFYTSKKGESKGVFKFLCVRKHYGFFRIYCTDLYKCYTCGCEWESDPYWVKNKK